jgi:peptidoglycan/xylan/chitin deacetylase (PgdA/CDA1 family)
MRRVFLILVLALPLLAQKRMAITIDDLPFAGAPSPPTRERATTNGILRALRAAKAPAIGFANGGKVDAVPARQKERLALLARWLDAGFTLGNHTYSHPDLNKVPLAEYTADILRGEGLLKPLLERRRLKIEFFRHPFTHTGPDEAKKRGLEAFLATHGYRPAPFTVEHVDYLFNQLHERALERGDKPLAARLRAAYLAHLDTVLDYYEPLARRYFGRDIPHILLIHANPLNAECLPAMLTAMLRRGYGFVSLEDALRDVAYRTTDLYVGPAGLSWLHRWSIVLGRPFDLRNEPDPPRWVLDLAKQ